MAGLSRAGAGWIAGETCGRENGRVTCMIRSATHLFSFLFLHLAGPKTSCDVYTQTQSYKDAIDDSLILWHVPRQALRDALKYSCC